jgi:hypothetical protein
MGMAGVNSGATHLRPAVVACKHYDLVGGHSALMSLCSCCRGVEMSVRRCWRALVDGERCVPAISDVGSCWPSAVPVLRPPYRVPYRHWSGCCVLRNAYCVMRTAYCVLRTAYSALRGPWSVVRAPCSMLRAPCSVLRAPCSVPYMYCTCTCYVHVYRRRALRNHTPERGARGVAAFAGSCRSNCPGWCWNWAGAKRVVGLLAAAAGRCWSPLLGTYRFPAARRGNCPGQHALINRISLLHHTS